MSFKFTEYAPETGSEFSIAFDKVLFSGQSKFQKISIIETEAFGRVLLIDDLIMLTERDEFVYHEMIAHVPLFAHPNPTRVLVIGGGDGGTVRECLKHSSVIHIDLVDIDEMVTQACLSHMPSVASQLLSSKVSCHFQDGVAFVQHTDNRYDVVIIDSTDPISVGEGLFSRAFYQNCYGVLTEDGILVNQSESPSWQAQEVARIAGKLTEIFPAVHYYHAHIPTYPSGHWAFGFASKRYHPIQNFQSERYQKMSLTLNYYNDELHKGSFALPTFFRKLLYDT